MSITAQLIGGDKLIAKLDGVPPNVVAMVNQALARGAMEVDLAAVRKTSGDVLNVRTGRLHRSITVKNRGADASGVQSFAVGTNVEYAAVHEYGLSVTIKQHLRMMTEAFGRPVKQPRQILVKQHTAKYPERSFLRSSLQELSSQIKADVIAAAKRGAAL